MGPSRNRPGHQGSGVFADYRLRMAEVLPDYRMTERGEAPPDSRAVHEGD